jgi:hypothetical protein
LLEVLKLYAEEKSQIASTEVPEGFFGDASWEELGLNERLIKALKGKPFIKSSLIPQKTQVMLSPLLFRKYLFRTDWKRRMS